MAVRGASTAYQGSFYAKADGPAIGPPTIRLVNNRTGAAVVASTSVPALGGSWQRYEFTLKTGTVVPSADNHLEFLVQRPGTGVVLPGVALPSLADVQKRSRTENASIFMEKLAAMHPAFLRFPGGNHLEGEHLGEHYEWKKTIGPLVDRPTPSHATHLPLLRRDRSARIPHLVRRPSHGNSLLAVFAGYFSPAGTRSCREGPRTLCPGCALDEIEYVSGDTSTRWGAERAKDGHPAAFHLTFMEIGK